MNEGGSVTALDRQTNEVVWNVSYEGPGSTSPVVHCNQLLVQTGNEFIAYDSRTGAESWRTDLGHGAALANVTTSGDTIFVCGSTEVQALAPDGTVHWTNETETLLNGVAVRDETVVVCGYVEDGDGLVRALDRTTGDQLWTRSGIRSYAPPSVGGGTVYLTGAGGDVTALDLDSGETTWRTRTGGSNMYATPAFEPNDGRVVVPTGATGQILALDAADGSEVWRTGVSRHAGVDSGVDG